MKPPLLCMFSVGPALHLPADQQLLLEERLNTASVSQEVGAFVELLWTEALGRLSNVLLVSIDKLSLNDVRTSAGRKGADRKARLFP